MIKHKGTLVLESATCLKPHSDSDTSHVLGLFGHYKRGFLLKAGGVEDQPKYYLDLMATIDWYISDGG